MPEIILKEITTRCYSRIYQPEAFSNKSDIITKYM